MKIDDLTGSDILEIKKPEKMFSGDEKDFKKIYKKLSLIWHPDRREDGRDTSNIFAHINELYQEALKKIKDGTFGTNENALNIETEDGKKFIFRYLKRKPFEMGTYYIANKLVMWQFEKKYDADIDDGLKNLKNIKYHDEKMRATFSRYIPKLVKRVEDKNSIFVILEKNKDFLNLGDVLEYNNNKIEPRHAAWIISTMYNNACLLNYNNIMHGGINADNYYINPETHEGMLLGGWWYSKEQDNALKMLSREAINVAPVKLLNNKKAQMLLDLEMIKQLGRKILGDATGIRLKNDSNIPEELLKWLKDGSKGTAVEQYAQWNKSVLPESFGKRTFMEMKIKSTDIYSEV